MATAADEHAEREATRKVAERYRKEFIDLREQRIDPELFRAIPADLMFRYNFVPLEVQNNLLSIAVADPSQVLLSDELSLLLGKKLVIKVATLRQISDLLKRTEQSQRVLEQATEAFTLQIGKDEAESEETISGDRLTRDSTASPVVRLVETIIFTALERRASDIHIEARDAEVAVKYRIDGVLQGMALDSAVAHQGAQRSRHCRAAHSSGRAFPREVQGTLHRPARVDHAGEPRRRRCASRTG
jgi:type IV pilus assembly protein PilB